MITISLRIVFTENKPECFDVIGFFHSFSAIVSIHQLRQHDSYEKDYTKVLRNGQTKKKLGQKTVYLEEMRM